MVIQQFKATTDFKQTLKSVLNYKKEIKTRAKVAARLEIIIIIVKMFSFLN